MSSLNTIPFDKLARLVGTANCPVVMGIRRQFPVPLAALTISAFTRVFDALLDAPDRA